MLEKLLKIFGYYKLNTQDQVALIKYYSDFLYSANTPSFENHLKYLGVDERTMVIYKKYPKEFEELFVFLCADDSKNKDRVFFSKKI